MKVAVVGAGVVGLSTAINILENVPGVDVTVIADKFEEETTSSGAGGHFRPNLNHIDGVPKATLKRWAMDSRDHFFSLAASGASSESGTGFVSGYLLQDTPEGGVLEDIVLHFRRLSQEEMTRLNFKQRYCYVYTTVITEMKKYLKWLAARIVERGGRIQRRKLSSLQELCGVYEAVVNCCGLGARQLVGDSNIHAVRGQLVKVRAPWVNMFYTSETKDGVSTYVYPHSDVVNLGGSRQVGDTNLEPDLHLAEDIIRRTKQIVPALEGATVVDHWVGLRPTRTPIRIEQEVLDGNGKDIMVVHNYGHGALGITLSWGTALEATGIVKRWALSRNRSKL
ncbi:D-aspartate oxidase-like [Haliotis rubra]|uniref:D-aspartate oxidase-like n=1 Tax=Haliotis rubra TaxID=36100 RepID=UPI001EE4EBC5|nr:D-aspartate oxidase-like [Haliotis rubra]XP_046578288.1 D-aspartate oxidase-like [Haliotis rubra]